MMLTELIGLPYRVACNKPELLTELPLAEKSVCKEISCGTYLLVEVDREAPKAKICEVWLFPFEKIDQIDKKEFESIGPYHLEGRRLNVGMVYVKYKAAAFAAAV
jgi:hypothetical protein